VQRACNSDRRTSRRGAIARRFRARPGCLLDNERLLLRYVLGDPRRRPYFAFGTSEYDGELEYGLRMAPSADGAAVVVTVEDGTSCRIEMLRHPLPRRGGSAVFYLCPGLPAAASLPLPAQPSGERTDGSLRFAVSSLCETSVRLSGPLHHPWGRVPGVPLPREPWDPRAVSDPRMVLGEFPTLLKGES
jgi:hypothetical protein